MKALIVSYAEGEFDPECIVIVNDGDELAVRGEIKEADDKGLFEIKIRNVDDKESTMDFIRSSNE